MARETIVVYTDDIDGSTEDVRPVRIDIPFEYAGSKPIVGNRYPSTTYEIDLSRAHRDDLVRALAPFVEHARRVTGYNPATLRPGEGTKIREWAAKRKITLKPRGRIPADIVGLYRAEND